MPSENEGVIYENRTNALLKKYKLQKNSFQGAKTDKTKPDAQIIFKGKEYFAEVKSSIAKDFGQIPLQYDLKKKWIFSPGSGSPDLVEKFEEIGVLKKINKIWANYGPPRKFLIPSNLLTKKDADYDKKTFSEGFVDIPISSIAEYYNNKGVYYIQIGGFGLYYLGENPMNLNIPEFKVPLQLRIRLKPRGDGTFRYSFMSALQVKQRNRPTKSQADLHDTEFLKFLQSLAQK